MRGPKQRAIDVVDLVREIQSRPPSQLPGDLAAAEIELAAATDIIDMIRDELVVEKERVREGFLLIARLTQKVDDQ